ncbi:hypothetical protein [Petroclostridium sp. X23]|uniref:hypothetical protein n=1 Tax=Petroclostridium sp. X23 TaxID=3045146 RepID=UPI0024AE0FB7|nr:hypothetical protein [Petroclostridium sp. X23]WHH60413.1 hypothetical protein QKW49_06725 [Petroclostridium sp. X23]
MAQNKQFVLQCSKCVLVVYENELFKLPQDILMEAIKRGKGHKRAAAAEKRNIKGGDP